MKNDFGSKKIAGCAHPCVYFFMNGWSVNQILCLVLREAVIPVVVNGPVGLPPPRSADVAPVPLVAVLL